MQHVTQNIQHFSLDSKYWQQTSKGLKTVEGRINDGKAAEIHVNEIIEFINRDQEGARLYCRVTEVKPFDSFEEMLETIGLDNCLPGVESVKEGLAIYHGFPGYAERAKVSGVVAFSLELLSSVKPPAEDASHSED